MPAPAPQTSTPKLLLPPLQNVKQKPLLRMNSMENKTSFMKSVVHDCQVVDHSHWNYDIIHLDRTVSGQPMLSPDWTGRRFT